MKFNLIKKILFTILIFIIFLKITDITFNKFVGLGNPLIYQHSKIFGYDIKPNQKVKRRGKTISINDLGMRNLRDWNNNYDKKILFLGDSVTFGGSIINDEDTFVLKTCKKLQNIKVMCGNFSVNGFGIESISKKIEYKNFSDEDLIIIVFIGNDFERGLNHIGIQPYFSKEIFNFYPALTELMLMVIDKFRNKLRYDFANLSENNETYKKYQLQQINNLKKIIKKNNKKYFIFYSPEYSELENNKQYFYIKEKMSKEFKNFIDLTNDLRNYKEKIYFDGLHLNKFGHEIYANLIFEKVQNVLNF